MTRSNADNHDGDGDDEEYDASYMTQRLEQLLEWMDEEEFEKVVLDCQSLRQQPAIPATLRSLLQEIELKSYIALQDWEKVIQYQSSRNRSKNSHEDKDEAMLSALKAYAFYRQKQYAKALALVTATASTSTSTTSANDDVSAGNDADADAVADANTILSLHIRAQSLYRLQSLDQAAKLYNSKVIPYERDEPEGHMQVLTNALAVQIAAGGATTRYNDSKTSKTSPDDEDDIIQQAKAFLIKNSTQAQAQNQDFHDLLYNLGTLEMMRGDTQLGQQHLMEAQTVAQKHFEDDANFLQDELRPIQTNLAWSQEQPLSGTDDYVSQLNASVTARKMMPKSFALPPNATLHQKRLYHYNQAILGLQQQSQSQLSSEQYALLKHHVSAIQKTLSNSLPKNSWFAARCAVLEARLVLSSPKSKSKTTTSAATTTTTTTSTAVAIVNKALAVANADDDKEAISFLQLQLADMQGLLETPEQKVEALSTIPLRNKPAVVATRAALLLSEQSDRNINGFSFPSPAHEADFWLSQKEYEKAADCYQRVLADNNNNDDKKNHSMNRAKYALCLSYMEGRSKEAFEIWNDIKEQENYNVMEQYSMTVDGEALEQAPLPRVASTKLTLSAYGISAAESAKPKKTREQIMKRRAKKREAYLAAASTATSSRPTPNPERWLPKYERHKKNRHHHGGGQQHKGAQGAATEKDVAKYDVLAKKNKLNSNNNNAASDVRSTAHMTAVVAGGTARRR